MKDREIVFATSNDRFIWENWRSGWRKLREESTKWPNVEVWENFGICARAILTYVGSDKAELHIVSI